MGTTSKQVKKKRIPALGGLLSPNLTSSSSPLASAPVVGPALSAGDFSSASSYLSHVVSERANYGEVTVAKTSTLTPEEREIVAERSEAAMAERVLTKKPAAPSTMASSPPFPLPQTQKKTVKRTSDNENDGSNRRGKKRGRSRTTKGVRQSEMASCVYGAIAREIGLAPPPSLAPISDLWKTSTLEDFYSLRDYLNTCQSYGIGAKSSEGGTTERVPLPRWKDLVGWQTVFDGNEDGEGMLAPEVSIILQMDQVMVRKIVSQLIFLVGSDPDSESDSADDTAAVISQPSPIVHGWTRKRGLWLYSLLARIELPIGSDDEAELRQLWRCCEGNIGSSDDEPWRTPTIRTIALLVKDVFGQGG